jgi:hypothetical protein
MTLVPGGDTNTPMISDEAGFDRTKLIQPDWRYVPKNQCMGRILPGGPD